MSKILAVCGATGKQGGSVLNYVLKDPELSKQYKIRAITSNPDSEKAQDLKKKKVEVVQGDFADQASLERALVGAHTIFIMTTPAFGPGAYDVQYDQGKRIVDAAVASGIQYIIFSTLPSIIEMTNGECKNIPQFDSKAAVEKYIRGLSVKSSFYAGGSFMENFQEQTFLAPQKDANGTWVLTRNMTPEGRIPLIDASGDTGKFVGAILAEPDKFEGKTLRGAERTYSMKEVTALLAKSAGQEIVYRQVSDREMQDSLPDFLAPIFTEGFPFMEKMGYFGPGQEDLIKWSVGNARGKVTTFEEFLEAHPFRLE